MFGLRHDSNDLLGSGWILIRDDKRIATLGAILVDTRQRRKGWVKKISTNLLNVARARGVEHIDLVCASPSASRIYESLGFKILRNIKVFTMPVDGSCIITVSGPRNPQSLSSTCPATKEDWDEIQRIADHSPGVDDGQCLRAIFDAEYDNPALALVTRRIDGSCASFGCLIHSQDV